MLEFEDDIKRAVDTVNSYRFDFAADFFGSVEKYLKGEAISSQRILVGAAIWGMLKMGIEPEVVSEVMKKVTADITSPKAGQE